MHTSFQFSPLWFSPIPPLTPSSVLTFFHDVNDVSLFEGELVCVSGVIVIDGLALRQVGLGSWWRLLTSFGWWPDPAEHGPATQCEC